MKTKNNGAFDHIPDILTPHPGESKDETIHRWLELGFRPWAVPAISQYLTYRVDNRKNLL